MSKSVDYTWRLEQERKRQAYLDRIRGNASRFRDIYQEKLRELVEQGLEEFAPGEFAGVRADLDELDRLLGSNPEAARTLSYRIRDSLSGLPGLARAARRESEESARRRRAELAEACRRANAEVASILKGLLSRIKDPVAMDFAYQDLTEFRKEYEGKTLHPGEIDSVRNDIESRFEAIALEAAAKAEDWKSSKKARLSRETSQEMIGLQKNAVEKNIKGSKAAQDKLLDELDRLSAGLGDASAVDEVKKHLDEAAEAAEEAEFGEDCRRILVQSIVESLKKVGFVVSNPKRHTGEVDEVVVRARKPSGHEALFRVQANGAMAYKFHEYEGMECRDDIDKVLPLLQDVYGIDLSEERVTWENPDRISKDARPIDGNERGGRHG